MGISPSAVQSRRFRLGLPTLHTSDLFIFQREELVEHFDPSVVADHIAAAGYVERKCNRYAEAGTQFWFWSRRIDGQFTSEEWHRLADRQRSRPSAARLVHRAPTLTYASQPF